MSATIGRGVGAPSDSFINLSNDTDFSTQEILLGSGSGNQDNLNTSLASCFTPTSNEANTIDISFIDTPGTVDTYTYGIRILSTASANTVYIRQSYINLIKLSN
jgi:hypothetical protein